MQKLYVDASAHGHFPATNNRLPLSLAMSCNDWQVLWDTLNATRETFCLRRLMSFIRNSMQQLFVILG